MARAAGELGAAVDGMEKATEKILKSAEVIDDSAKALAAALKTDYERGLAQDIQEHVVQIYEACNFQDLGGQRIGNVIETLTTIEDQVDGHARPPPGPPGRRAAGQAAVPLGAAQRTAARRRFRPHQPAGHRRPVRASPVA